MGEPREIPADVLLNALMAAAFSPPPFGSPLGAPGTRIKAIKWSPMTPENGQINDCLMIAWGPDEEAG